MTESQQFQQTPKQSWKIDPAGLTINQLVELTGYSRSALAGWSTQFDIPFVRDGRRSLYLEPGQKMFKDILDLKAQFKNEAEIARALIQTGHVIRDSVSRGDLSDSSDSSDSDAEGLKEMMAIAIDQALERQAEQISRQLEKQTELSKLYGETSFTVGQLQERVANLQFMLEEKNEQLRLLPAAVEGLQAEKVALETQCRDLEHELRTTRAEMELLTERVTVATDGRAELAESKQSLQQHVDALAEKLKGLETDHATVLSGKDKELARLQAELTGRGADLQQQAEQLRQQHAENEKLKAELDALKKNLETQNENHQIQVKALEGQKAELQQALEQEKAKGWWAKMTGK